MKTNELEKEIGLSKYTIWYYEKEGLIQPKREENGYRDYDDETVQKLKIIKFLRNLQISVDDIKAMLEGELDFRHCLKINQVNIQKQIESMNEIKDTIDDYYDKDLPLIEELSEIKNNNNKMGLEFRKTTSTISLGRKLTPGLARRQLIITFIGATVVAVSFARMPYDLGNMRILVGVLFFIGTFMLMIAFSFKQTSAMMLDNTLNQSVEFLSDGIYYYQFNGPMSNFKYFFAVVFNKKHQFMHKCLYEDIEKFEVVAKKNYMSTRSPLAYEAYVSDFKFTFKNRQTFYFYWPMILNDDARYIATIVEKKVKHIEDPYNILYAMKQGINLNDYLIGRL